MRRYHRYLSVLVLLFSAQLLGEPPASKPTAKDPTLDWLLNQSSPSVALPTTHPATQPATPFADTKADLGYRKGFLVTSDGEKLHTRLGTTLDKPVRLWVEEKKEYRDIPYSLIQSIDVKIIWEREEREWHFKESGSDIKEFSGKTYPAREMAYTITLANGQTITGSTATPIYVEMAHGNDKVFILHKRDKGEIGQTLKDLIYVKHIELDEK